jgi:hypothetical protein
LSPPFDFVESEYYQPTMGSGLRKQWAVFRERYDPASLADHKHVSNALELDLASLRHPIRAVNIDPGYMSMTKLILASTKNREHRIYLRDGIYAEVTLAFRDQTWQVMPWTYADYQRPDVRQFLFAARRRFADSIAEAERAARGSMDRQPSSTRKASQ